LIRDCELPFRNYHTTNCGQASKFEFAQEIYGLWGVLVERVVVTDSSTFVRPAKRPAYSVLGQEAWKIVGSGGATVDQMGDWRLAFRDAMPAIISATKMER